jgi:iron complex transport system substrate-binding protein
MAPQLLLLNGEHEAQPAKADMVLKHPALRALDNNTIIARASLVPLLCPGPWSAAIAGTLAQLGRKASAIERNQTAR